MSIDYAAENNALFQFLLRYGDDRLVLGHRLSEWCGHAPILEEDLALANTGLDLLGQAQSVLQYAGDIEGKGRNEDTLAYKRTDLEFRNLLLCEQENGDFAKTIARQFFFDAFALHFNTGLAESTNEILMGIGEKAVKEDTYHLRHSARWFIMLGDGTSESNSRLKNAVDDLWKYVGEMFIADKIDEKMAAAGVAPELSGIKEKWLETVERTFKQSTLEMPDPNAFAQTGGRKGIHTEALGHMLAEMQILPRTYPQAEW